LPARPGSASAASTSLSADVPVTGEQPAITEGRS
jgi:hypothetical protein